MDATATYRPASAPTSLCSRSGGGKAGGPPQAERLRTPLAPATRRLQERDQPEGGGSHRQPCRLEAEAPGERVGDAPPGGGGAVVPQQPLRHAALAAGERAAVEGALVDDDVDVGH